MTILNIYPPVAYCLPTNGRILAAFNCSERTLAPGSNKYLIDNQI